jgi:hypothetical protein
MHQKNNKKPARKKEEKAPEKQTEKSEKQSNPKRIKPPEQACKPLKIKIKRSYRAKKAPEKRKNPFTCPAVGGIENCPNRSAEPPQTNP